MFASSWYSAQGVCHLAMMSWQSSDSSPSWQTHVTTWHPDHSSAPCSHICICSFFICNVRQSNKFYDGSGSGVQLRGDHSETRTFHYPWNIFKLQHFVRWHRPPCLSSQALCVSGRGSRKLVRGLLKFNLDPCLNLASSFCLGHVWHGADTADILTPRHCGSRHIRHIRPGPANLFWYLTSQKNKYCHKSR